MVDRKTSMDVAGAALANSAVLRRMGADTPTEAASVALDRIQQRLGTTIPKVPPLERVRHKKTGGTYVIVSRDVRLHSQGPAGCTLRDMQLMSVFTIGKGPDKQYVLRRYADDHPKQEAFYCSARVQVNFDGVIYEDKLPFVLYRSEADRDRDEWVRPVAEFDDGRFEEIDAAAWETPPAQIPPATPADEEQNNLWALQAADRLLSICKRDLQAIVSRGCHDEGALAGIERLLSLLLGMEDLPSEPFFHVHIASLTTSAGTTHYVCIDRADRPADASPWDEQGRNMPYHSPTLANAEIVAKMWDEFLNGNRGATS